MPAQGVSFQKTRPHHIGLVVRDIESAIAHLEALGFGPFRFDEEHRVFAMCFRGELHGEPAEWVTKISSARLGEIELELLEPAEGGQALAEALEARGEGLHHIGWLTTDLHGDIEQERAKGARVLTSSLSPGQPGFAYLTYEEVSGLVLEVREPDIDCLS